MRSFRMTLPKLYQYCLDMGITPKKSLTLDVKLDDKSDEFKWAFLRGVIDGDGCVSIGGKRLSDCRIIIYTASEKFAKVLAELLQCSAHKRTQTNKSFGGCTSICYSLVIVSKKAQDLAKKLPLGGFSLERKTKKLQIIINRKYAPGKPYDESFVNSCNFDS